MDDTADNLLSALEPDSLWSSLTRARRNTGGNNLRGRERGDNITNFRNELGHAMAESRKMNRKFRGDSAEEKEGAHT